MNFTDEIDKLKEMISPLLELLNRILGQEGYVSDNKINQYAELLIDLIAKTKDLEEQVNREPVSNRLTVNSILSNNMLRMIIENAYLTVLLIKKPGEFEGYQNALLHNDNVYFIKNINFILNDIAPNKYRKKDTGKVKQTLKLGEQLKDLDPYLGDSLYEAYTQFSAILHLRYTEIFEPIYSKPSYSFIIVSALSFVLDNLISKDDEASLIQYSNIIGVPHE